MAKTKAVYSNNARTTLAIPLTNVATTLQVVSPTSFPVLGSGIDYFMATLDDGTNLEIVKVTNVTGAVFTIARAQEGTVALAFASGTTKVEHRLTADSINRFARKEDRMEDYASVETLPNPSTVNPNSVLCASIDAAGSPIVGLNNGTKWTFINYPDKVKVGVAGAGATTTSINSTNASLILNETTSRSYIIQFTSGANQGLCRFITSMTTSVINWTTALPSAPGASDTYEIYRCAFFLSYPKGGGSDKVFMEADSNIWSNYTVPTGKNAGTPGPITIQTGVTVEVSTGSTWTIF